MEAKGNTLSADDSFMIRMICVRLDPKSVYLCLASLLQTKRYRTNPVFVARIVSMLNLLLLTAEELQPLRSIIRDSLSDSTGPSTAGHDFQTWRRHTATASAAPSRTRSRSQSDIEVDSPSRTDPAGHDQHPESPPLIMAQAPHQAGGVTGPRRFHAKVRDGPGARSQSASNLDLRLNSRFTGRRQTADSAVGLGLTDDDAAAGGVGGRALTPGSTGLGDGAEADDIFAGPEIFQMLFKAWCFNPASTFSLCLLARAYELASHLMQRMYVCPAVACRGSRC